MYTQNQHSRFFSFVCVCGMRSRPLGFSVCHSNPIGNTQLPKSIKMQWNKVRSATLRKWWIKKGLVAVFVSLGQRTNARETLKRIANGRNGDFGVAENLSIRVRPSMFPNFRSIFVCLLCVPHIISFRSFQLVGWRKRQFNCCSKWQRLIEKKNINGIEIKKIRDTDGRQLQNDGCNSSHFHFPLDCWRPDDDDEWWLMGWWPISNGKPYTKSNQSTFFAWHYSNWTFHWIRYWTSPQYNLPCDEVCGFQQYCFIGYQCKW